MSGTDTSGLFLIVKSKQTAISINPTLNNQVMSKGSIKIISIFVYPKNWKYLFLQQISYLVYTSFSLNILSPIDSNSYYILIYYWYWVIPRIILLLLMEDLELDIFLTTEVLEFNYLITSLSSISFPFMYIKK